MAGRTKQETIFYRRSRFSTRLPIHHRYTLAHQWFSPEDEGLWRLGLTKFATRMLGDLVEYEFQVKAGDSLELGQTLGWIEGFKALSNIYCVMSGEFCGDNPDLAKDITAVDRDPYGDGWLYRVRGEPDPNSVDVHAYIGILDATIDKMLAKEQESGADG